MEHTDVDVGRSPCVQGWCGHRPSNMLEIFYSSNGNNDVGYSNPEFDRYIDISRSTMNMKARSDALHGAEDVLMETVACIPVAYFTDYYLQSPRLTGVWHSIYGYWYFMYADITD